MCRYNDRAIVWSFTAVLCAVSALIGLARAAEIPHEAQRYRADLTRSARLVWGLSAPVATMAAQVHQESGWRRDARSPYAHGLAQFTPDTAEWIASIDPALVRPDTGNPAWALRALARYDRYLWDRAPAAAPGCDRWAFALAGYNGGAGWVSRDRRKAAAAGVSPDRWWGQVERFNAGRAEWAFRENRDYPRKILLRHEPLYVRAGWGRGACV